ELAGLARPGAGAVPVRRRPSATPRGGSSARGPPRRDRDAQPATRRRGGSGTARTPMDRSRASAWAHLAVAQATSDNDASGGTRSRAATDGPHSALPSAYFSPTVRSVSAGA